MATLVEGDSRYAVLNHQFHFQIYEAAASPMLLSMMRLLWHAMPDGPKVTRSQAESVREHAELVEALAAQDEERAAAVTQGHIIGTEHLDSEIP